MIKIFAIIEIKKGKKWLYVDTLEPSCTFLMLDYDFYDDLKQVKTNHMPEDIDPISKEIIEGEVIGRPGDCSFLDLKEARKIYNLHDVETRPSETVFGFKPDKNKKYRVLFWFSYM